MSLDHRDIYQYISLTKASKAHARDRSRRLQQEAAQAKEKANNKKAPDPKGKNKNLSQNQTSNQNQTQNPASNSPGKDKNQAVSKRPSPVNAELRVDVNPPNPKNPLPGLPGSAPAAAAPQASPTISYKMFLPLAIDSKVPFVRTLSLSVLSHHPDEDLRQQASQNYYRNSELREDLCDFMPPIQPVLEKCWEENKLNPGESNPIYCKIKERKEKLRLLNRQKSHLSKQRSLKSQKSKEPLHSNSASLPSQISTVAPNTCSTSASTTMTSPDSGHQTLTTSSSQLTDGNSTLATDLSARERGDLSMDTILAEDSLDLGNLDLSDSKESETDSNSMYDFSSSSEEEPEPEPEPEPVVVPPPSTPGPSNPPRIASSLLNQSSSHHSAHRLGDCAKKII